MSDLVRRVNRDEIIQDIWLLNLKDYELYFDELLTFLTTQEKHRYENISVLKNKVLFGLRKGLTRYVLSHRMNQLSDHVTYGYDAHGKPFLHNGTKFNVSHTKHFLLIGLSDQAEIGVDVEGVRSFPNVSNVFSSSEESDMKSYNAVDKTLAFFKIWTQKEAVSKAFGEGIAMGLDSFSVHTDPMIAKERYEVFIKEKKCSIETIYKNGLYIAVAIILD